MRASASAPSRAVTTSPLRARKREPRSRKSSASSASRMVRRPATLAPRPRGGPQQARELGLHEPGVAARPDPALSLLDAPLLERGERVGVVGHAHGGRLAIVAVVDAADLVLRDPDRL